MEFMEKFKVFSNEVKSSIDKKYKEFEQSNIYQNTKKSIMSKVQNNDFLNLINEDLKKENKTLKLENNNLKQRNETLRKENKRLKIMFADKMLFSENQLLDMDIPCGWVAKQVDIPSLPNISQDTSQDTFLDTFPDILKNPPQGLSQGPLVSPSASPPNSPPNSPLILSEIDW